ncbi:MAG: DUF547 domain-containing protein, partial [Thermoanaerobaculia bacterium]|nr:DUF547 domain-containing protein [Thermoanaerobaculia bacterium]
QRVLERHLEPGEKNGVSVGLVDYAALARGDRDFQEAREQLALLDPKELSPAEAKATWINAYNVLAVAMVVDNYPLESIRDAGGRLFGRVWTQPAGKVGGTTYTLDQIENDIIRPLGDPRIHAAIVCASVSCPDLATEPFTARKLDEQLDEGLRSFLANPAKGLRVEGRTLKVSSIFDWFADDFKTSGGVLAVLRKYAPAGTSIPEDPKLDYLTYDWQLNGN